MGVLHLSTVHQLFFLFLKDYLLSHQGWDTCQSLSRIPCWLIRSVGYWSQGSPGVMGEEGVGWPSPWQVNWLVENSDSESPPKNGGLGLELKVDSTLLFNVVAACARWAKSFYHVQTETCKSPPCKWITPLRQGVSTAHLYCALF